MSQIPTILFCVISVGIFFKHVVTTWDRQINFFWGRLGPFPQAPSTTGACLPQIGRGMLVRSGKSRAVRRPLEPGTLENLQ